MSNANIITTVALVLVGLPAVLNAIPDLNPSPEFNAVLAVLALIGGVTLKQQPGSGLSDADVARIAAERERLRRIERDQINAQRTVPRG